MCGTLSILPICAVVVGALCFVLQFIVLPSDEWGHFATRRIRGFRDEKGHFGLWRLCSTKGANSELECVHPESDIYRLPTQASAAGALSIVHLLLLACFVVLAAIRVIQIAKRTPDRYLGTKRLCVVKVAMAIVCVILSISVSILASTGEGIFRQYIFFKGWAFWIQIVIISVDIVLLLVCAFENIQYWQARMLEPPPPDPTDAYPETFITPDYDLPPEDILAPERVVYVKDAGVQSQLDGDDGNDNYLRVPDYSYGKPRRHEGYDEHDNRTYGNMRHGPTIITFRDSPHPKKKATTAHPTRVI